MENQDQTHVLHSFQRNEEEQVRFAVRKYKGKYYIDLRIWFQTEGNPDFHPTKRGISLSLQHAPELRKGIERLTKAMEKFKPSEKSDSLKG